MSDLTPEPRITNHELQATPESQVAKEPLIDPVASHERIAVIDILRGIAILGILLVNMQIFSAPMYVHFTDMDLWPGIADRIARWLIRFLAENKFYSLFSLLFGLGFAIQMRRAEAKGRRFLPLFTRRMLILFVIGICHAYLIWMGDILTYYAVIGFLLIPFRRRAPRTLIIWSLVLLVISPLLMSGLIGSVLIGKQFPEAAVEIEREVRRDQDVHAVLADQSFEIYAHGTWSEIFAQRSFDVQFGYFWFTLLGGTSILAMFLIGSYIARRRILEDLDDNRLLLRRMMLWCGAVGVGANLVYAVTSELSHDDQLSLMSLVATWSAAVGAPTLCLFYLSGIALLTRRQRWLHRLRPLGNVGRLALSNYLLQSVVCTMIFYSYGLGFYGRCGPAFGLVLTLLIYAGQVVLSTWWINHFRFGPMEWLWRTATYRHMPS